MSGKPRRKSGPLDGGDVFTTPEQGRQRSPFFKLSGDDSNDLWANLEERHRQHKQHVKWLAAAVVLISIFGVLVHDTFFGFALILFIPLTVELVMIRQTRPKAKISDYRTPDAVEVTLDVECDPDSLPEGRR
jgi:hypothetical protein